jgi:hypothetical protein
MPEPTSCLVVAAFWSTATTREISTMPLPGKVARSAAVVRFTPEQAAQPGLVNVLRRLGCVATVEHCLDMTVRPPR